MSIDMGLIMKQYINAERYGNWRNHLLEVRNMLPYIVSVKHTKY